MRRPSSVDRVVPVGPGTLVPSPRVLTAFVTMLLSLTLLLPLAPATAAPAPAKPAAPTTALAQLNTLTVKGRAPKTGYKRGSFAWRADVDRNGCDTRNDVLRRDLRSITLKSGTKGCVVAKGTLTSPYTGKKISFNRSRSTVDIDHVVSLSDAWQTGARTWGPKKRRQFANDPLNLLAVEASQNRKKGDGDAATWLPAKKYRCDYVARQVAVKSKYGLWVKKAEKTAMTRVLNTCKGKKVVKAKAWPKPGKGHLKPTKKAPAKKPAPKKSAPKKPAPAKTVYYKNCDAVRKAGKAPLKKGSPGYRAGLDRDKDGWACE